MKRFYLIITAMLMCVLTAGAQSASTVSWGYCDNNISGTIGAEASGKAAIYIPAEVAELYKGAEITGLRVGLGTTAQELTIFVTKDLDSAPVVSYTKKEDIISGWNVIAFPGDVYTITGEPFYIGYEAKGTSCPIGYTSVFNADGCWADLGGGWTNYAESNHINALALQARIKGVGMPNDMALLSVKHNVAAKNKECYIQGTVMSMSPKLVKKYQIAYSIDGGEEQVAEITKAIGSGITKEFSIAYPGFADEGTHTVDCRILSVSGGADAYEGNNRASGAITVVDHMPKYRMTVEEGTGLWCKWCPQGIVGFKYMEEKYPDNFVGIAIHRQDALSTDSYSGITFSSYPNCYVNRNPQLYFMPLASSLESAYESTSNDPHLGEIEVSSEFTDGSKTAVTATATVNFITAMPQANYRVAFVATEDNVSGYGQANAYAGGSTPMGGWENKPSTVYEDMQHVARQIWGLYGIDGSLPSSFEANKPVEFTQTLELPVGDIQNADNVNIIALLFNIDTGLIENAAEARIGKNSSVPTAIADVANQPQPEVSVVDGRIVVSGFNGTVSVYTIDGKKVNNAGLAGGIYIVKGDDGKQSFVKRVML